MTSTERRVPFDPYETAALGGRIYEKLRARFEAEHPGRVVAIDVRSEKFFLGSSPEAAYRAARSAQQTGPFHFVRVGETAVYRMTSLSV